jgi:hypothetical protein
MRKVIEIEGMGIDLNYHFDSNDNVVIKYVNDFWDSGGFLEENIEHSSLEVYPESYINGLSDDDKITYFYQLSHREQCEIIKEMIEDKIDEYKEELYPTQDDYEFNMEINAGV